MRTVQRRYYSPEQMLALVPPLPPMPAHPNAPRGASPRASGRPTAPRVRETSGVVLGDTWDLAAEYSGDKPGAVLNRLVRDGVLSVEETVVSWLEEMECTVDDSASSSSHIRMLAPVSGSGIAGLVINRYTEDEGHLAGTVTDHGGSWQGIPSPSSPFTVYALAHHMGEDGEPDWAAAAQDVATIPEVQAYWDEQALEEVLRDVDAQAQEESEESEDSHSDDLIPRPLPMSLWNEHPVLQTIYDSAAHAKIPAESVLGAVLMLTSYAVPWNLVMDPSATSPKSLAVHVAIVGDSSAGKNKGYGVARRLLRMENPEDDSHIPWPTPNSLGSGEGLTELFYGDEASQMPNPDYSDTAKKGTRNSYKFLKVPGFHRHEALLWDGEMDAVTKRMVERAGSTLDGELRKATHGEGLGQTNVKARLLPEMSYKLVHGMAGQEHSAQKLTQGEALGGGLTSRYLFVNPRVSNCAVPREGSTFDPRTTCVTIAPPTPSMLMREVKKGRLFYDLQAPPGVMHGGAPYSWDLYTIRLHPDTYAMWLADEEEKVRRAQAREARGIAGLLEDDGEPDKHLLFKRLKVAYVLGVLCEGTLEAWTCVLPRWYEVAGVVMEHHSQTIRYLQTFAEAKAHKALRDKAVMELGARTHARERFTDEQLLKGAKVIARKVAHYGDEGCSARDAYATLPGRLKKKDMPQKADYLTYAAEQGWATMKAEGESVWVTITEAGLQAIS